MNKRLLFVLLTLAAGLVFEDGRAGAGQKDPASSVDRAKVVTSTVLPAPDVALGDEDTTAAGVAGAVVGANDTTSAPLDPPSSGTTFWVDNTPFDGDCPQATFTTIQAAVNASGPNDTIKVCPGTYTEQVQIIGHIHDGIRLESLTPLAATIKWPAVPSSNHQLVNVIDRYQKNGVQAVNPGTFVDVRSNTITYYQSETAFIAFRAAPNGVVVFREAAATVEQNVISGNHWTVPLSTGVILDEAPSGSSQVNHNRIFDNDFGIESDTQTGLEISHNDVFNNLADGITLCGDVTQGCGPAEQIVVRSNDIQNRSEEHTSELQS